jgi:hypothetical protein
MELKMVYEILDDNGQVINTIIADEDFVKKNYLNRYRLFVNNDKTESNDPVLPHEMFEQLGRPEELGPL